MHANLRRGLLCSLFTGGLLVLGTTVASAADTTTGADGIASGTQIVAPVTAPVTLGATSVGLLSDPAASTTANPAGTDGTGGTTTAPAGSTSGSDGIASGTQIAAPVTAPVTLGAASVGLPGDPAASTSGSSIGTGSAVNTPANSTDSSTSGADGVASGSQGVAPVTAAAAHGAASVGLLGDLEATAGNLFDTGSAAIGGSLAGNDGSTAPARAVGADGSTGTAAVGSAGVSVESNTGTAGMTVQASQVGARVSAPAAGMRSLAATGSSLQGLYFAAAFLGTGMLLLSSKKMRTV